MASERERNANGEFTDRIPADAALDAFDAREDAARPLTAADVMEALDCSRRTAHNKLNALVDEGSLQTRKVGARGRVWWRPIPAGTLGDSTAADAPNGRPTDRSSEVRRAIEDADLPGSGTTLQARREALTAAYEYLTSHPSATKSDFLDEVYPDYPANFETPEGWWNAIQPALKQLPAVDPPEERGHLWQFLGGDRFTPTLG
ncbi:ArsR family transcriptional regulator [Natronomonas sp.]|uniref:ArsR family transcriptional regulator n=1 Tax=Natronomonas sp. TaxID=2184060 RepID=UPI0039768704